MNTTHHPIPACRDCRAPAGAPCDTACPSHTQQLHDHLTALVDAHEDALSRDTYERWSA